MAEELTELEGLPPAGIACADCEDDIYYEEECILLQVVQPQMVGGIVHFWPVMDETGVVSDFQFEPYHFCFHCWEDLLEKVKEEMQDVPPLEDELSVIECSCCGSGIREWERVGTWTIGEFLHSRRAPLHQWPQPGPRFNTVNKPEVLCTYCLVLMDECVISMWEDFPDPHTCSDCVQMRCWRYQECGCTCHEDEGENE
jgi:hypothetical protein